MKGNVRVIKLDAHKTPEFREERSLDWIKFGTSAGWSNQYPDYLLSLYNRSAKHNAIINGKVDYITGGGFKLDDSGLDQAQKADVSRFLNSPNPKETLNDILDKTTLDLEIFNGFLLEVVPNKTQKRITAIYCCDFKKYRRGKGNDGWWYSPDGWKKAKPDNLEWFPDYDPNKFDQKMILYISEYNPTTDVYPIPGYIGAVPYVEMDIEIANFHLNGIKNGFIGGTLITFYDGVPTEEEKEDIEDRVIGKFTGTDNANSIVLNFANGRDSGGVDIDQISGNDLDKRYAELNKQVQQEIFSGHRVTDPNLFGIKQDGIFASRSQLIDSYELFNNTYISGRQKFLERVFNDLLEVQGYKGRLTIEHTEPISVQFSESTVVGVMEEDEIREKAGLPPIEKDDNVVGSKEAESQAALKGSVGGVTGIITLLQNVKQGVIEASSAMSVLTELYGFTPEKAAATVLGTEVAVKAEMKQVLEHADAELKVTSAFSKCGLSLDEYEVVSSRGFYFQDGLDAEKREMELKKYGFIDTAFEMGVLDMIKENPSVTFTEIAAALNVDLSRIVEAVNQLSTSGYLTQGAELIEDTTQRILNVTPEGESALAETIPLETSFTIAYRYVKASGVSGPDVIDTTRDFCREMVALSKGRVWTLAEIQQIGMREGRNVWLRKGGFWTRKGTNQTTPYCRHQWEQLTVKKK